jgi:hypothetical protein
VEKKTRDMPRQDGSRGIDDVDVPIRGYDE